MSKSTQSNSPVASSTAIAAPVDPATVLNAALAVQPVTNSSKRGRKARLDPYLQTIKVLISDKNFNAQQIAQFVLDTAKVKISPQGVSIWKNKNREALGLPAAVRRSRASKSV